MDQLQQIIEAAFERRAEITPRNADAQLKEAVDNVITQLDQGKLRVAEKIDGDWVTHQWLKKAVLLSFRLQDNAFIKGGFTNYYDKVPSKFADYNSRDFREGGFRVVPPAAARKGAYIAKNVVLMSPVMARSVLRSGSGVALPATSTTCEGFCAAAGPATAVIRAAARDRAWKRGMVVLLDGLEITRALSRPPRQLSPATGRAAARRRPLVPGAAPAAMASTPPLQWPGHKKAGPWAGWVREVLPLTAGASRRPAHRSARPASCRCRSG